MLRDQIKRLPFKRGDTNLLIRGTAVTVIRCVVCCVVVVYHGYGVWCGVLCSVDVPRIRCVEWWWCGGSVVSMYHGYGVWSGVVCSVDVPQIRCVEWCGVIWW